MKNKAAMIKVGIKVENSDDKEASLAGGVDYFFRREEISLMAMKRRD